MRFHEIVEGGSAAKVVAAQAKKAEAARGYQDRLRTIRQSTPAPEVAQKEAKARQAYQSRTRAADANIRSALEANRTSA